MNAPAGKMQLSSAPDIYWRKTALNTIVIDERNGRSYCLSDMPQVIWSCLTLSYSYSKIVRVIAQMRGCAPEMAEEEVRAILFEWLSLGLVQAVEMPHG